MFSVKTNLQAAYTSVSRKRPKQSSHTWKIQVIQVLIIIISYPDVDLVHEEVSLQVEGPPTEGGVGVEPGGDGGGGQAGEEQEGRGQGRGQGGGGGAGAGGGQEDEEEGAGVHPDCWGGRLGAPGVMLPSWDCITSSISLL